MGTVIILSFVLLTIAIGALSRIDNMKWDDVKKVIEKQKEIDKQLKGDDYEENEDEDLD